MNSTLYRIPNTNLYLRTDGSFSPNPEPDEQVLELTKDYAQVLEVAYPGNTLQQMSLLRSENGIESHEALGLGLDLIEIFTLGMDVAKKLNDWITKAHDAPDPMMQHLRKIHNALSHIQDFNLAAWVSSREDNLAFLLAHSSNALHTANAFLQSQQPRTDPVWAAKIAIAERDSLLAVQTFTGDLEGGYWLRPESIAAMSWVGNPTSFHYGWMPHMPDRAEVYSFKRVWDHRWALPALTYAIAVRVAVLKAFWTGSQTEWEIHCVEIKKYINFLASVFMKMESGVRKLDQLSDYQINNIPTKGVPIAAVDVYGGYYVGGLFDPFFRPHNFPSGLYPHGIVFPTSGDLADILSNVKKLARYWWNHVCVTIGLPDLLALSGRLESLCEPKWVLGTFADVQSTLRSIRKHEKLTQAAFAARGLANLTPETDTVGSSTRTFQLYQALQLGGDRAQAIVAKCVEELSRLAESVGKRNAGQYRNEGKTEAKENS